MATSRELKEMSQKRLSAIKVLYKKEFYDFVCSDAGYVLEFGLKATVCKSMNRINYPESIKKYRTHSLVNLVDLANLKLSLEQEKNNNINFYVNWSLLSKWSVNFRYEPIGKNKKENAKEYINAIENEEDGVYPWVKTNW